MSDGRGIEAARKESTEGDIGHELAADGLTEIMTAGFDGVLLREWLNLLRVVRRDEAGRTHTAIGAPFGERPRQEFADAFGGSEFARRVEEREVGRDGLRIERPVDTGNALERLELRGEDVTFGRCRPIERLHASGIARE